jgi:hypothetical protein
VAERDAYMQPGLRRDREAATGFFRYGPRAIRDLRLRHAIRSQPLSRTDFERLIRAEVDEAFGPFDILVADAGEQGLGRSEARGRLIADALRGLRAP